MDDISDIKESYMSYLKYLRSNEYYVNMGYRTPMGCFLNYDKVVEDMFLEGFPPDFHVEEGKLHYKGGPNVESKMIMPPDCLLDKILEYHISNGTHHSIDVTLEKMKENVAMVPEEVVQKVVEFCDCGNTAMAMDVDVPTKESRNKSYEEMYSSFLETLKSDESYVGMELTTPIKCFIQYDGIIEDLIIGESHPDFYLQDNRLYYVNRQSRESKMILPQNELLEKVLECHIRDEIHQSTRVTLEKLRENFALVPEEVVAYIVDFCGCGSNALETNVILSAEGTQIRNAIREPFMSFVQALRSDLDQEERQHTALNVFLFYEETVAEVLNFASGKRIKIQENKIYWRNNPNSLYRRVLTPDEILDQVFAHHIVEGFHKACGGTITEMRKSFGFIPEQVVAKILELCTCRKC